MRRTALMTGKELTENELSNMKCGGQQIKNTMICVTHVPKDCLIQTLKKQFFTKYKIFTKLPQISHFHKNHIYLSEEV